MKANSSDWYKKGWSLDIKKQSWTENTKEQVDFIIKALSLTGREKILDLACGYGRHSLELARRGYSVTGVDITPVYIEDAAKTAKEEHLKAEFICEDIRKQKGLTQEELAEILFVSRSAISKWESGRGYPGIDSLKAISAYFAISMDELLSNKELILAAEQDNRRKIFHVQDIVFGLLDCSAALFLLLPLFSQKVGNAFIGVSLIGLTDIMWYTRAVYIAIIVLTVVCGILILALQNVDLSAWRKIRGVLSVTLSVIACLVFIATSQIYAALLFFLFMLIKGILLIKRK
ncbi:MAG: helix-turn-helix domain-containing protein [Lachnospiraceae bacterium]|nr:helix-turn-helix domain-containing protein [Lachnospiraceae bacterium]